MNSLSHEDPSLRSSRFTSGRQLIALLPVICIMLSASASRAAIIEDGLPNVDDDRLYAWYDGNDAIGADGNAETPIWPNRQGEIDRDITNGFGGGAAVLTPVESENGNMALRYEDVVTWRDASEWGDVFDNFTVFVAATVRDPFAAFFFTGNQGGGGAEANANFQTLDEDVWSMKGEFREDTAPLTVDELQYHSFVYDEDGLGQHYINGEFMASADIGLASLSGFVLGGRQNGAERASVDFSEVLVYDGIVNEDDRKAVETYLENKFFGGSLPGDYDGNGVLDAADIDLQAGAMSDPSPDLDTFDENSDGVVNRTDRLIWVHDHADTWVGDANLDGLFDTGDLVAALASGEYEDELVGNSGWATGDWDGDGDFTTTDLIAALADGGYENGPRPAAIPEPAGMLLFALGTVLLSAHRRNRS